MYLISVTEKEEYACFTVSETGVPVTDGKTGDMGLPVPVTSNLYNQHSYKAHQEANTAIAPSRRWQGQWPFRCAISVSNSAFWCGKLSEA